MKASPPAFDCTMCGNCCRGEGGIVVSRQDQLRLSDNLGLEVEVFLAAYTIPAGTKRVLAAGRDGSCIFFAEGTGCSIHAFKPDICRAWPYFRGNLIDETSWIMAQEGCPGITPEAGHAEFVRQGCRYLARHGLAKGPQSDVAAALIIDCSCLKGS